MPREDASAKPSSLRPDIPPGIERIILKSLQKRAEDRYRSFREVRTELEHVYAELTGKKFARIDRTKLNCRRMRSTTAPSHSWTLNHEVEAERTFKKALQLDPHHPEAVYNAGLLEWSRSGNPDYDLIIKLEEVAKRRSMSVAGSNLWADAF